MKGEVLLTNDQPLQFTSVTQRLFQMKEFDGCQIISSDPVFLTLYFGDTGLACHLAGLETSSSIKSDPLFGALFETYAARNLLSILNSRWEARDLAGLKAFLRATPHCVAAVLCHNGEDSVKMGEKLWALPVNLMLS